MSRVTIGPQLESTNLRLARAKKGLNDKSQSDILHISPTTCNGESQVKCRLNWQTFFARMHNPIYSWRSTEEVSYIFEPATKVLKVGVHEIQTVGSLPVSSQSVSQSVPLHFSIQFTKAVMISIRKASASQVLQ